MGVDLTDLVQIILKYSAKVWCCFSPAGAAPPPPSPLPSKCLKWEDKLRTFLYMAAIFGDFFTILMIYKILQVW